MPDERNCSPSSATIRTPVRGRMAAHWSSARASKTKTISGLSAPIRSSRAATGFSAVRCRSRGWVSTTMKPASVKRSYSQVSGPKGIEAPLQADSSGTRRPFPCTAFRFFAPCCRGMSEPASRRWAGPRLRRLCAGCLRLGACPGSHPGAGASPPARRRGPTRLPHRSSWW